MKKIEGIPGGTFCNVSSAMQNGILGEVRKQELSRALLAQNLNGHCTHI